MKAILVALSALILSGCASMGARSDSSRRSSSTAVGTLAGAAAGAYAGSETKGAKGAAVGAAGGAIVGYAAGKIVDKRQQQATEEAYEAGRRAAAADIMARYWEKNAVNTAPNDDQSETPVVEVAYPAGTYQGVRMLPHSKPLFDTGNSEPQRK